MISGPPCEICWLDDRTLPADSKIIAKIAGQLANTLGCLARKNPEISVKVCRDVVFYTGIGANPEQLTIPFAKFTDAPYKTVM